MIAATEPRPTREATRLLVVDRGDGSYRDSRMADLPGVLRSGDLLVVNDAATLPASVRAKRPSGLSVEIRLVRYLGAADWLAAILGEGSWRIPTELRDLPETLHPGDRLDVSPDFFAEVMDTDSRSNRLVTLRFSRPGPGMWAALYAHGRPIQYSYVANDLDLWSVQTAYASRPWAMEMPSAGYSLTWKTLLEMKRRGIVLASLTHSAGISAAGDDYIDASLPVRERFEIPPATIEAIRYTRDSGGRVIAVGTTVVRALEGSASMNGSLVSGQAETDVLLDRSFPIQVVDGILTGIHDPAQSHFRLLRAFADEGFLRRAWRHANDAGYRCHEFGDVCLIL